MAIGLGDGRGSFFEIVDLAQLVSNTRQDLLHGQADWTLRIRDDGMDRHRESILDLAQHVSEVLLASAVKTAGEQDFTREGITQDPEHILGFEGLEPINGQDDMPLLREAVPQTGLVRETQGEQFFVALQQIGDGARRDDDVEVLEGLVDFRDRAMLAVA